MVHPEESEAVNTSVCMAERALITRHAGKRCRYMPGTRWLRLHADICPAVARLTVIGSKGRMNNGGFERSPDSGQVANVALRHGRHMVRQFDVDIWVAPTMTSVAGSCRSYMGVGGNQRQPGDSGAVANTAFLSSNINMD